MSVSYNCCCRCCCTYPSISKFGTPTTMDSFNFRSVSFRGLILPAEPVGIILAFQTAIILQGHHGVWVTTSKLISRCVDRWYPWCSGLFPACFRRVLLSFVRINPRDEKAKWIFLEIIIVALLLRLDSCRHQLPILDLRGTFPGKSHSKIFFVTKDHTRIWGGEISSFWKRKLHPHNGLTPTK